MVQLIRTVFRSAYIRRLGYRLFFWLDALGVHVLPKHPYSPMPDWRWLRAHKPLWMRPLPLAGIDWDLAQQMAWLFDLCRDHLKEVRGSEVYSQASADGLGGGYNVIDAQILHCFIRRLKPRRIIEVGGGTSTACMVAAARWNREEGHDTTIVSIEPFPRPNFKRRLASEILHIEQRCQECLDVFESLRPGDLLFIDSTHALKIGSEVVDLWLRVIPRLHPGVYIQAHDVNLPYAYPLDTFETFLGWQESVLVAALLTGNTHLRVLASLSALAFDRPASLQRVLPEYVPGPHEEGLPGHPQIPGNHFPNSLWLLTS